MPSRGRTSSRDRGRRSRPIVIACAAFDPSRHRLARHARPGRPAKARSPRASFAGKGGKCLSCTCRRLLWGVDTILLRWGGGSSTVWRQKKCDAFGDPYRAQVTQNESGRILWRTASESQSLWPAVLCVSERTKSRSGRQYRFCTAGTARSYAYACERRLCTLSVGQTLRAEWEHEIKL